MAWPAENDQGKSSNNSDNIELSPANTFGLSELSPFESLSCLIALWIQSSKSTYISEGLNAKLSDVK